MTTSVKEEVKQEPVTPKKDFLPTWYIEVSEPFFRGRGDHSVKQLEDICEGYKEYAHQADIAFYSCSRKTDELKKQNHELLEATKELMRFKSSMKYAMSNALNEPENFLKALDNLEKFNL